MWSQLLLCLLVSLTAASTRQPGWKPNSQYLYHVRARTVASLNQISNDYSGIVLKADLLVSPTPEGNLEAKIVNPQYAEIHANLKDGWTTQIPDSELAYQALPISSKSFQLIMEGTTIRNLVVDGSISNWEANIIKSIASQLQLDTKATNLINSHYNLRTENDLDSAVFKTMEETVTGVSETLYEIHPLPEYVLQSTPWLVPKKDLHEGDDIIEVIKSKNFTHSPIYVLPSYHFGLEGINRFEPANQMADFSSRTSETRAVITGNWERYTIQSVVTVDEISVSPTMMDKQQGSVKTMVNVTFREILEHTEPFEQPSNPVKAGLVYRYNDPFSASNNVREGFEVDHNYDSDSSEAFGYDTPARRRLTAHDSVKYYNFESRNLHEQLNQEQPQLNEPPKSPMLPFTVGYNGQAFSKKQDLAEITRKLAQQIGEEVQRPEDIPSKNTVGKFLILTSLLRTMKPEQMQQVAENLYTQEQHGAQAVAWQTYRDAVAEAGTGPAFMTIRSWIKDSKISKETAARVLATSAYSFRQPTEEYMREFFSTIIKDEQIMNQQYLNESALLSYTELIHQVCVHWNVSHSKYPVHSFGFFCTEKAEKMMEEQVIPYLTEKLQQSVSEGDVQKIHVYIRALGNIGHQHILNAFEPYLEGEKQVSQYQRLLMVVALDKLVKANPRVARSVLYKIYQNPTENEQVRAAAVFQLMRTNPPASMLQRMASYTNVDPNHYVNAAVRSSIQSASKLQGSDHAKLRSAAHSAKPLLTPHQYGNQYSHQNMSHYVVEPMQLDYHQQMDIFGSKDSFFGKGFKYNLQGRFGGFERQLVDKQAIVSSIDDLINVFYQQTEKYQSQQQQKQSQPQHPWSSETIAQILNMDVEHREQLEGSLYEQIGYLQKIWSFDNQSIEHFPRTIQQWEEDLKNGKTFEHTHMMVNHESAFTFPTALGLPFIYTYDNPIVMRLEANVKAVAEPSVSNGEELREPKAVQAEYEIRAVLSGRTQTQFGFFTPYNSQRYSAGYDKNFQVFVPLVGNIKWDVENKQVFMGFKSANGEKNIPLLHYSSWPYTANYDIYSPEPQKNIIKSQHPHQINQVIGKEYMGIAINVQVKSDNRIDLVSIYEKLQQHDPLSVLLSSWPSDNIQHSEVNIGVDQQQSFTKQIILRGAYKHQYQSGGAEKQNKCEQDLPEDYIQRQEEAIRRVSAGIKSADAHVVDATVSFQDQQGQSKVKYSATISKAKSNVDPKGNFFALFKKYTEQEQPLRFCVEAKTKFPNTNGLNLDYAMNMDTSSTTEIKAYLQGSRQESSNIVVNAKFAKSEKRLQYLKEQQEYKECQRQMHEGNTQLPICARVTAKANLLDHFQINVVSNNIDARVVNFTYKAYSILRHHLYPRFQENIVPAQAQSRNSEQNVSINGQFSPDLNSVYAYINTPYGAVEVKDVELNQWVKHLLVPHPVFHTKARMMSYYYKYDTFRPICVVDKTAASTFDNKTYPVTLSDDWTVLLHYVPRRPLQDDLLNKPLPNLIAEHLKVQIESYIIFVRSAEGSSKKEIKMVVQSEGTQQRGVEIELRPRGGSQLPKLYVDKKEVRYTDQEATDIYNGYIQVYALPNNEVKVEVKDAYYVIYDGDRVKLTVVNGIFRDASRGLCGTFTGEPETDFLAPNNCILKSPEDFVKSYTIETEQDKPTGIKQRSNEEEQCYRKKVEYVNVISNQDKGANEIDYLNKNMMNNKLTHKYSGSSCTKVQTKYILEGGEVCFTLRPLPGCKPGCSEQGIVSKDVPVHCVQQTKATGLWMKQIDKGASPDFSSKSQSKTIRMNVPQRCLA